MRAILENFFCLLFAIRMMPRMNVANEMNMSGMEEIVEMFKMRR